MAKQTRFGLPKFFCWKTGQTFSKNKIKFEFLLFCQRESLLFGCCFVLGTVAVVVALCGRSLRWSVVSHISLSTLSFSLSVTRWSWKSPCLGRARIGSLTSQWSGSNRSVCLVWRRHCKVTPGKSRKTQSLLWILSCVTCQVWREYRGQKKSMDWSEFFLA